MQTRFPGMKPCSRPFAHFEHNGDYITALIHNDLLIRAALIDYVTLGGSKLTNVDYLIRTRP